MQKLLFLIVAKLKINYFCVLNTPFKIANYLIKFNKIFLNKNIKKYLNFYIITLFILLSCYFNKIYLNLNLKTMKKHLLDMDICAFY